MVLCHHPAKKKPLIDILPVVSFHIAMCSFDDAHGNNGALTGCAHVYSNKGGSVAIERT